MVDLPFARTETSNWAAIGLAANLLMTACANNNLNHLYTGGYANTGDLGGIQIGLVRTEAGVGNGTEIASVGTGAAAVGSA